MKQLAPNGNLLTYILRPLCFPADWSVKIVSLQIASAANGVG
jgi:hypothetical protein